MHTFFYLIKFGCRTGKHTVKSEKPMSVFLGGFIKRSKSVKNELIYCAKSNKKRQITVEMNENERNILTDCGRIDKMKL